MFDSIPMPVFFIVFMLFIAFVGYRRKSKSSHPATLTRLTLT